MSNFPLYNTLLTNLPNKDLTIKQKNDLIKHISKFKVDECKLVFALIRSYYLDKDNGDVLSMPYEGLLGKDKTGQNKITYDLAQLPIPLRQLLYKFITVHEKSMEETPNLF